MNRARLVRRLAQLEDYFARHRKAVVAFFAPAVAIIVPAAIAGDLTEHVVASALGASVLAYFGVSRTRNRPEPEHPCGDDTCDDDHTGP